MVNPQTASVSVVIPCYNQARFLGEAIESVLKQTHSIYEIIVVNDGSTDNTAEVASRYPGVRCINQQNQGLAAARNTGLRESKNEYLVFLDADDRLLPDCLKNGLECLNAHAECALAFGHCSDISIDGKPLSVVGGEKPQSVWPEISVETDYYAAFLLRNWIAMPAMVMYKREVFEQVGEFRDSVIIDGSRVSIYGVEDYDLYLRVTRVTPVACHDNVVAEYRRHGASLSRDYILMLKSVTRVMYAQSDYVKTTQQYKEAYKLGLKATQSYYSDLAVNKVRRSVRARSNWLQAARDTLRLTRHHPREVATHAFRKIYCVVFRVRSRSEDDLLVDMVQD